MSELEKLFYYYNAEVGKNDFKETKEASENVWNYLKEKEKEKSSYLDAEEKIIALASANEKQGFINGFQYAVTLLTSGKPITA